MIKTLRKPKTSTFFIKPNNPKKKASTKRKSAEPFYKTKKLITLL